MSIPHRSVVLAAVMSAAFGAAITAAASAVAGDSTPAAEVQECAAFPVPWILNPSNVDGGGREGQKLPKGWKAVGGGVMEGRPMTIACR